jgi:hypothetical protein
MAAPSYTSGSWSTTQDIVPIERFVRLSNMSMRELLVKSLTALFAFSIIASFILFAGWGYKRLLVFPDQFIYSLLAATIAEQAGMLYIVIRSLFKTNPDAE